MYLFIKVYNYVHMKIKNNIAISESGFIFHPQTGESFMVNSAGQEILSFLREGKSFDQIRDHFLSAYYVDETTLEKDYQDFLGMLEYFQIVENEPKKEA